MAENDLYTRAPKTQMGDHQEYTDLQIANPEEINVSTTNQKAHYDNGSKNGTWWNQSNSAYVGPTERSTLCFKKPPSRRNLYILTTGGVVLFVIGLIIGILIGSFAIDIGSKTEENGGSSNAEGQSGHTGADSSKCTCPTLPSTSQMPTVIKQSTLPSNQDTPVTATCSCPPPPSTQSPTSCSPCERRNPREAAVTQSLFAPLTKAETDKVITKINSEGLTGRSTLGGNYIDFVYLFPVDKSSALKYLDSGGPFPYRYAKVHITRGSATPPDVMIYKIGPVNETLSNMVVEKQIEDGEIHFNRRSYDNKEASTMYGIFGQHMNQLKDMLKESFDGAYYRNGISVSYSTLYSLDDTDRRSGCYLYMYMPTGGATMRILPVSFILHHPGVATSAWYASDFYYLNQGPFASSQELAEAYANGTLRKIKLPNNYRSKYAQEFPLGRNSSLPLRDSSDIPPPRTYEPKGPRYTIRDNVIFWMDWQCEFSVDPIKGPAMFNVRFKGNRIAYEISLQDITLVYASGTTGAGVDPPVLSDTEFLLGDALRNSRLGFGCPDRASVLHAPVYKNGVGTKEVACVFEADPQRPMWRHKNKGLLDHHLVIRSPMNLGNYDYTLEFRFYLDGRLETIMAASGTLYGAFWDPEDPLLNEDKSTSPFGFRIAEFLSGPIHSHDFVFKVDLDIMGTTNSFQKVNWKGGDILSALQTQKNTQERPGFFPFNYTRYIDIDFLEKEAGLVIDPLNPSYWTVVNENEKNRWGVNRGYRIIPSFSDGEPEILTQHLMFKPWLNMKYHCAVTKRKETEPYGTDSLYDIRRPTDPIGGLINSMDDENIRNEDLVIWINAKFIHAPTSEDVPMTIGVDKGFVLKPFNYFDTTPTFDVQGHYTASGEPYQKVQCYEP